MSVTIYNIATALGVEPPSDDPIRSEQWEMWISDAEMLIETRRLQLDVEEISQAKLDYVVREAVVAHVKRPEDATQVTVSVDDGSTSKSFKSGKGRVTIIDEWWALLGLTDPSGAFSVDMLGTASLHLPWCSIYWNGGSYCSCGVDIAGYPIFEGPEW